MTKQMVIATLEKCMMEEKKDKGDKKLIEALKVAIKVLEKQCEHMDYEV